MSLSPVTKVACSHILALREAINDVVNKESPVVNSLADVVNTKGPYDEGAALPKGGMVAVVDAVSRQTKWQQDNRDRYNEKMRDYMKKRRAAKKPLGIPYG